LNVLKHNNLLKAYMIFSDTMNLYFSIKIHRTREY
jgi:hypothetical protein